MNPYIDIKEPIRFEEREVNVLLQSFKSAYKLWESGEVWNFSTNDLIIAHYLFKMLNKRYQEHTETIMYRVHKIKKYTVSLNKFEMLWLTQWIDKRQLVDLSDLKTNRIEPFITN